MSAAGIIMDVLLMGLLLWALWFGMRLNARLKALKAGQEDFAKAVADLDQAAIRAHTSLRELHGNAEESQELLHGRILAARDLITKLEAQITKAERTQKDLQTGLSNAAMLHAVVDEPVEMDADYEPESVAAYDAPPEPQTAALRSEWARARSAEARRTYDGRRRPAFTDDEDADDLPPLRSAAGRVRDANDRMATPDAPEVSDLGLAAISEMLRTFAKPHGRAPEPAAPPVETPPMPASRRSRLPSPVEDDLFDASAAQAPAPLSPFRRTR